MYLFPMLVSADENKNPHYEALSYTWSGADTKIQCNDIEFNTTSNLRNALTQLRLTDRCRYIWADQICINQSDSDEKERNQIPLLPQIYANAQRVLIWLGKDNTVCVDGMRFLRQLLDDLTSSSDDDQDSVHATVSGNREINRLLNLPWFSRVWVLQEVAMAQTAILIYGSETLPWDRLEKFNEMCQIDTVGRWTNALASIARANDSTTKQLLASRYITAHVHLISRLKASGSSLGGSASPFGDALLLTQTRTCQATFQKDKVLSLFAFLSPELRSALVNFDNGKYHDTATFYHKIAQFELGQCLNMDFLEAAGLRQRSESHAALPSWVPDWTVTLFNQELWLLNKVKFRLDGQLLYAASKNSQACAKVNEKSEGLLEVKVRIIDTIVDTGKPFDWTIQSDHPDHAGQGRFGDVKAMIQLSQERYSKVKSSLEMSEYCRTHYGSSFDAACKQTLVAGIMQIGDGSNDGGKQRRATDDELDQLYANYFDFMDILLNNTLHEALERLEQGRPEMSDFSTLTSFLDALSKSSQAQKLLQQIQDACKRRVFFVTDDGYMGLGPQGLGTAQVGDKICVVQGCHVPFVIRPHTTEPSGEQSYQLVGEAYVHGLMDGEAMTMASASDENLTLR